MFPIEWEAVLINKPGRSVMETKIPIVTVYHINPKHYTSDSAGGFLTTPISSLRLYKSCCGFTKEIGRAHV